MFSAKNLVGIAILISCLSLAVYAQGAGDWPQWRGPNRDGISKETGLLKQWPKDGPPLVWTAKGAGRGYSTVSVSNDGCSLWACAVIASMWWPSTWLQERKFGRRLTDQYHDIVAMARAVLLPSTMALYALGGNGLSALDAKTGRPSGR